MTLSRAKRVIATLVALCVALGVSATFGVRVMKTNMNSISMNTSAIHNQMASPMDTYECTEVIRVNSTGLETTVFLIVQKSQIVSYILCIISVAVLYILIYRSVSRVFKRREQLKGNHKVCKQKSKMKEGKVNGITPNAQICSADSKLIETTKLSELKSHKSEGPEESNDAKLNLPAGEDSAARENDICDSSIQISERLTVKAPVLHPLSTDAIKSKGKSKLMTLGRKRSGSRSEINVDLVSRLNTRTEDTEPTKSRVVLSRTKHLSRHYKDSPAFHNLKTAAMLFVVAILYIVTFLPAMLMVNELISLNLPIFYLYYANNAMNPVIYGFMNPNFRADIRQLFLRKRCSYGKGRSAGSLPRRPSVR
ncbi:unnamed protein product [Calicophoron daubneyi]|uniref:G-protein coupled receptors family 1 profile domain-containing protein n=1 Tax=Calicophoron daubneyi TaxID=300641 RepID=A0AAV2T0M3_CALDB